MPVDSNLVGAVVFFYDAESVNWRVRSNGDVEEIPEGQGYPRSW